MPKDVGTAHGLHQLMRSWLLAEDPYGMNQRIEPTMGTTAPPAASPAAAQEPAGGWGARYPGNPGSWAETAPAPDTRAAEAGPQAVANQLFGGQGARYSESGRNAAVPDRASMKGEAAVERALAPSSTAEAGRNAAIPDRASMAGENAVDKALNPPMGSGGGFWAPGEAADTASAVGQRAVEGALTKAARNKVAKGRLKDPIDPDDRQPE
jgi:hypothetical protein